MIFGIEARPWYRSVWDYFGIAARIVATETQILTASPRLRYAAAVCFLAWANPAPAADYYVAPTGLDSDPGSEAQPWRTIQKAADSLSPGDTVYVRAGTYGKVSVHVSGSAAGGFVTFSNYPGETPVIDAIGETPPPGDTALFLVENRSYVIIRGFELRNYKTSNVSLTPAGILLRGACEHVQIRNCNVHDIWNTGGQPSHSGNAFGIAVYGNSLTPATKLVIDGNDVHHLKTGSSESLVLNGNVTNFEVTNNTVHDNNNIGIDFIGFEGTCPDVMRDQARDGICRGNRVWNITSQGNQAYRNGSYAADGLYCDGATRIVLERNVVYDTDIGVELASEHPGKVTSEITLRNNCIYHNRQAGLLLGGYARSGTGGTDGCKITGNTFYKNDTLRWDNGAAQLRFRTSNCVLRNNIFYSGPGNWLVSVPVSAAHNINNKLDYNLYYAAAGAGVARWSWNNTIRNSFAAWKNTTGQDSNGRFAAPRFVSTSATPDLHLRPDSPAIDAGDPTFSAAFRERDIDAARRITGARVDIGADELAPSKQRAKVINFSGHDWEVRPTEGGGPGPNNWDKDNVWVDAEGRLHLKISYRDGKWSCAEVSTVGRLGFGRYEFETEGRVDRLDPNVVFGLFNYPTAEVGPDGTYEIDIEFARWGDPAAQSGNYTVWPTEAGLDPTGKSFAFQLNGLRSVHRFTWSAAKINFQSFYGDGSQFANWLFQPAAPTRRISQQPMPLHINLWCFGGHPPDDAQPVELIVRSFHFAREP